MRTMLKEPSVTSASSHLVVGLSIFVSLALAGVILLRFLKERQGVGPDPVLTMLERAPLDDELETPEEAAAVAEARAELDRGDGIPWEDVTRSLSPFNVP